MIVTLIITGLTFGFLLTLQAHALINANCPIWLSWIVASIFCILEIILMTIIFYLIITPFWQDLLFDDVLKLRGLEPILNQSRTRVSETRICFRGIKIKELSIKESRKLAWKNRKDYILFGIVAVALELIPIANFIFFWTNVVGAALWTSDIIIEERRAGLNRSVQFTRSISQSVILTLFTRLIVEEEESYQSTNNNTSTLSL
ncbi:439_t:CDS:2 [Diversispora eburnea]|uniref:439_t:CDS:1 n=2 Tax=Diversisporales TaxID=214509 RepID=A0A9N9AV69_9GLOM|nr:439_t:CDS:2 [Diversispora eburnea]